MAEITTYSLIRFPLNSVYLQLNLSKVEIISERIEKSIRNYNCATENRYERIIRVDISKWL